MTKQNQENVDPEKLVEDQVNEFNEEFARLGFDEHTAKYPRQKPKTILINGKKFKI